MYFSKEDLDLFEKLDFPQKPVAVSLLREKPEGVERLDEKIRLCEMVRRAREREPFYADPENHNCEAGLHVLGYGDPPQPFTSGAFAYELKGYKSARAGSRPYHLNPMLCRNHNNFVAFSTLEKLSFEPDLLLLCTEGRSTQNVLRALLWSTGTILESRVTLSMECSWYIAYPYITGEINHFVGSVGYATHRGKVWEPGQIAVCIPYEKVPFLMENLREIPLTHEEEPWCGEEGLAFKKRIREKMGLDTTIID